MQIILDGCLAFFAAVGVGAILLALIPTNTPEATSKMEAPLLVLLSVQGDGTQIQSLLPQLQKHIHSGNIILHKNYYFPTCIFFIFCFVMSSIRRLTRISY